MEEQIQKLREVRRAIDNAINYLESKNVLIETERSLPENVMIVGSWVILPVADWRHEGQAWRT
jgi:hypothetical protein